MHLQDRAIFRHVLFSTTWKNFRTGVLLNALWNMYFQISYEKGMMDFDFWKIPRERLRDSLPEKCHKTSQFAPY